jgi:hypothetical protein
MPWSARPGVPAAFSWRAISGVALLDLNAREGGGMYAVIGRVRIKPGHEEQTRSMIAEGGVSMIQGMAGSGPAYWARTLDGDLIQHSFWLFDTQANAHVAEATFSRLREMPDAPATFLSVEVCEVVGQA